MCFREYRMERASQSNDIQVERKRERDRERICYILYLVTVFYKY